MILGGVGKPWKTYMNRCTLYKGKQIKAIQEKGNQGANGQIQTRMESLPIYAIRESILGKNMVFPAT